MPWRAALLAAAAALSGCVSLGQPMKPPVIYAAWYEEMKDCVRDTVAHFERVRWFVKHEYEFRCGHEVAWGCYYAPHIIVLAERRTGSPTTVKHEMLHDLGFRHEDEVFTRCLP